YAGRARPGHRPPRCHHHPRGMTGEGLDAKTGIDDACSFTYRVAPFPRGGPSLRLGRAARRARERSPDARGEAPSPRGTWRMSRSLQDPSPEGPPTSGSASPKPRLTVQRAGRPDMNKAQLKKFKTLLETKRDEIVKKAKQTLNEEMMLDANDLPDEMDLASSEYLQSFTFRLRGREKSFLDKIQKALVKIEDGTFGKCEECEE